MSHRQVYSAYLELITSASAATGKCIQTIEMTLFSQTNELAAQLFPTIADSNSDGPCCHANVVAKARAPGLLNGKLKIVAEDDEHLNDFREYMPP
jgi:hypothetical protein